MLSSPILSRLLPCSPLPGRVFVFVCSFVSSLDLFLPLVSSSSFLQTLPSFFPFLFFRSFSGFSQAVFFFCLLLLSPLPFRIAPSISSRLVPASRSLLPHRIVNKRPPPLFFVARNSSFVKVLQEGTLNKRANKTKPMQGRSCVTNKARQQTSLPSPWTTVVFLCPLCRFLCFFFTSFLILFFSFDPMRIHHCPSTLRHLFI